MGCVNDSSISMAVRLGKYSGSLGNCARKYALCANFILLCAEKFCSRIIYIKYAKKHLCDCEYIYFTARIFLGLRRDLQPCTEIFSLAQKYLTYPQKFILCRVKLYSARKCFQVPQFLFYFARRLSRFMSRFYCLKPYWKCRGAVNK